MRVIPLTLKQANELVRSLHRHHKPACGHRFSLGCLVGTNLVGAAIVGRPVARMVDPYRVAEVVRLVTTGEKNACSFLYAACARVAREMGFISIQTYILENESGVSLKASGWVIVGNTSGGNWNHSWRKGRREDQPMVPKQKWVKELNPPVIFPKDILLVTTTDHSGDAPVATGLAPNVECTPGTGSMYETEND